MFGAKSIQHTPENDSPSCRIWRAQFWVGHAYRKPWYAGRKAQRFKGTPSIEENCILEKNIFGAKYTGGCGSIIAKNGTQIACRWLYEETEGRSFKVSTASKVTCKRAEARICIWWRSALLAKWAGAIGTYAFAQKRQRAANNNWEWESQKREPHRAMEQRRPA